jgi:hypothetical protein
MRVAACKPLAQRPRTATTMFTRMFNQLSQGFHDVFSFQLAALVIALAGVIYYIVKNGAALPQRRLVALSVAVGLLAVVVVAAGFRTPTVARWLGLPAGSMVEKSLSWIKGGIALAAAWLSVYEGRRITENKRVSPKWVKGVAITLAVLGIGAYFRFGDLGYSNYYHRWEFFHYYLGSKYDRELGYERLYLCTAVAQIDLGQGNEVRARKFRDLSEDVLAPTQAAVDHPEACRNRFTPERWESFKQDVKFFRSSSNIQYWNDMQKDHGYNPPPVWTVAGHALASLRPASDGYLKVLACIDPLFFIGIFWAIYWAFGYRVFAVAAVFWGCQLPAEYFWTGGAFMRQDWLFFLVLSACLTRKRYFALAGAAFAYSTLLRVFPGILLAGWAVVAFTHLVKHKRMAPSHLRVLAGGVVATVLLVSISIGVAGKEAYPEFYKHIQVHNHTPLTNNMGLATILAQSPSGRMKYVRDEKLLDAFGPWKQMRREQLNAFRPLHVIMLVALVIAFIHVVRRIKLLWIAQALALGIVISAVEITCYYYTIFILAAFLTRHRRGLEQWVLCIAGVSQLLVVNRYMSYYYDDRYTWQSVLFCVFSASLIFAYWPKAKKTSTELEPLRAGPLEVARTGGPPPPEPAT